MPRTLIRIFIAALLALVIPVQGMASVVAGQCMAFGHHDGAATQDHEHHAHDAGADGHDHQHAVDGHAEEGKSSHCGPCVACCASATMASGAWPSLPSAPSLSKYFFTQFPPLAVQPHSLDRPPLAF